MKLQTASETERSCVLIGHVNSYHQILCDPESWQYNCINTPFGTFQIKVMLQEIVTLPQP